MRWVRLALLAAALAVGGVALWQSGELPSRHERRAISDCAWSGDREVVWQTGDKAFKVHVRVCDL